MIIQRCFPAYASVTCNHTRQGHEAVAAVDSDRPTSLLLCGRTPLQNALRSLERPATTGRQALPRAVDEVLDHPDSGAQAFRLDIPARHRAGDVLRGSGEGARRWVGRIGGHPPDPALR